MSETDDMISRLRAELDKSNIQILEIREGWVLTKAELDQARYLLSCSEEAHKLMVDKNNDARELIGECEEAFQECAPIYVWKVEEILAKISAWRKR